ncbi:MAG: hypothetical protein QM487_04260 [Candidatus Marithrix sp.]
MKQNNLLLIAFFIFFISIGGILIKNSMPEPKSERIYALLKQHMPFELEKRFGGFSITSKITGVKEKPPASEVFQRLDDLEKEWGKTHLKLDEDSLIILNELKKEVAKIILINDEEKIFIKTFFGIK